MGTRRAPEMVDSRTILNPILIATEQLAHFCRKHIRIEMRCSRDAAKLVPSNGRFEKYGEVLSGVFIALVSVIFIFMAWLSTRCYQKNAHNRLCIPSAKGHSNNRGSLEKYRTRDGSQHLLRISHRP